MLVYANLLSFEPEDGRHQLIKIFSTWLSRKVRINIDAERVERGIRELNFRDGSALTSSSTPFNDEDTSYPFLFAAAYEHGDQKVPGRRWILEFGMRQNKFLSSVDCSIILKTDDKGVQGSHPTSTTRPRFVQDLVEACRPVSGTPGLFLKKLNTESGIPYVHEVESFDRRAPWLIVSPYADGNYPLDPEFLRNQVLGLAQVIVIASHQDAKALEEQFGRRYVCADGAIKIIWPLPYRNHRGSPETSLLLPDQPDDADEPNIGLERRILIELTSRLNVHNSLRHISSKEVIEASVRASVYANMARARDQASTTDLGDYEELLDAADSELRAKDERIDTLSSRNVALESDVVRLQAEIDHLRGVVSVKQGARGERAPIGDAASIRESVLAMNTGNMSLSQALGLIQSMFPDRIEVLPSALSSAKESDDGMFRHSEKAFDLLSTLATDYWTILSDGGSEQQAKGAFGPNAYSATENNLTNNGKRLRTFYYQGEKVMMEKHLKYGVKDSLATTLRIHFRWFDSESKIVIGHCGKHLDF